MIVRELISRFGFRVEKKDFDKANEGFSKLKKAAVTLVGVLVAGKMAMAIRNIATETATLGDRLDKVSEKLGINAQALQELRFAAEWTGVAQQTLDMALQRFTRRSAEAARGTGEAKDALAELGVKLRDSTGKLRPVESLLGDVAEGLRRTKGDGDRLRLAFKLFDSEGAALVTTLKGGRGALEDLRRKARETGGVLDEDLIAASVEYTDTQRELAMVTRGLKNLVAKELLPAFTKGAKGVMAWIEANRALINQKLGDFVRKVIETIQLFARTIWSITTAIYDWAKSLDPLSAKILKVSVMLGVLAVAMMLPAGPLILLAVLIGALTEDFLLWYENAEGTKTMMHELDMALGGFFSTIRDIIKGEEFDLGTYFGEWAEKVRELIQNIKDLAAELGLIAKKPEIREPAVTGREGLIKRLAAPRRAAIGLPIEQAVEAVFGKKQAAVPSPRGGARTTATAPVMVNLTIQALPGETVEEQAKRAAEMAAREVFESENRKAGRAHSVASPAPAVP